MNTKEEELLSKKTKNTLKAKKGSAKGKGKSEKTQRKLKQDVRDKELFLKLNFFSSSHTLNASIKKRTKRKNYIKAFFPFS